jgi:large subunit ribosomal protein L22
MKVSAKLNNLRIAPRKAKLVADLIRGLDIDDALTQLNITVKRSSPYMKKLLDSAIANAENNFGLDRNNLYVFNVVIGAGPTFKRWMPRAYGRASMILKRTSRVDIVLEERVEGKGRKTKEQLEKERKAKADIKKKEEKERMGDKDKKEKEENKKLDFEKEGKEENMKKDGKKKWTSKIFRRKSM